MAGEESVGGVRAALPHIQRRRAQHAWLSRELLLKPASAEVKLVADTRLQACANEYYAVRERCGKNTAIIARAKELKLV